MSNDNKKSSDLPETNPPSPLKLHAWVPLLVFALLALAIGGMGFFVFNQYQESARKEAHQTLGAIADLRMRQVAEWREERKRSAEVIARDPLLAREIERWLGRGAPLDEGGQEILQRLKAVQQAYDFQAAYILDERGVVRDLPITPDAKPPTAYGVKLVMEVMRSGQAVLTDLHPGAEPPLVRLDLVVPIFASRGERRAVAAIYFRIDPQQYLFPLLQSWPTPSQSAESVLLRREGDELVVLNNLRHRGDSALKLRLPVSDKSLLAARMARGEGGDALEGKDYLGVKVIGAARKVPDTTWSLIAKMDAEELYAPIHRSAMIAAALTVVFIAGAGVATGLWWRQQRARLLARQYEDERRHQAQMHRKKKHIRLLLESAAEGIYGVDLAGNITFANPACLRLLGYEREEELLGRHAHELLHHSHVDGSPYPAEKCRAYEAYLSDQGIRVDDEVFWRKDGTPFPVEYWSYPIHYEGRVEGSVVTFLDITERKRAEESLRLWARAMESSTNAIFIADAGQEGLPLFYVNNAFERITGFSSKEVVGKSCRLLDSEDLNQPQIEEIYQAIREQRDGSAVLCNYRKDGSLFWVELFFAPVRGETGRVTHFVGVLNDITERKRYEEQLERHANYDELTGLANRNLLRDRLCQAVAYTRRQQGELAVLHLDLDNFKLVVESLGHGNADQLLQAVAERLAGCIGEGDTAARWSGDEFVVALSNLEREADVSPMVQKILNTLSERFVIAGHELHVTFSVGIALFPKDGQDAGELLKNADAAMYRAKELGRNNFQFYAGEMNARAMERLMLENALRRALEREEFLLHYQPRVDLNNGEMVGMEALVRWRNPELGLVSPANFIPLAEETGLIVPIGEWVLRTACAQNKAWQEAGFAPLRVSVNLSARQFWQQNLVEVVGAALNETRLAPDWLELEITESLLMQNAEAASATLKNLKAMGISLSIDDFGTGYSSLGYLKRFPIDTLKIDRSFVQDIISDPDDAAIARAVVSLAHDMRLKVVAEGVENEEQMSFLRLRHCDEIQGYYFSKPLPAEEFTELLKEGRRLQIGAEEAGEERVLLLLDDEENILAALVRLLRCDNYTILRATNAEEAFNLLATHRVGVILSDQRMPGMTGVEFLRRAKQLYPETVRMILSGYTELKSVTDAVNEGAVYKFLTKPWHEDQLRANVKEAFRYYELARENERLAKEIQTANVALAISVAG